MTAQKTPANTTLQHASVGTRWHQLSAIFGVLLVGPLVGRQMFSLVGREQLSVWLAFLFIGLGMALPAVLVLIFQPMRQRVSVDAGGLSFGRRGRVPFSEIDQLRRQDFLTLHRIGRSTLIVQQGKHDLEAFNRFCEAAWDHWLNWRRRHGQPPGAARRASFYDTARMFGMITVGTILLIGFLALTFNVVLPPIALLILAGLFIVGLVCAIFYGA